MIDQSLWGAYGPGPYSLYLKSDFGWGANRSNFLVTEFNASGPGGSANTFPAYDGQWRAAAYAAIARGANMIMYWHWHSTHYGFESHVGGILNHAFRPTRAYREIARIGEELADNGEFLTDLTPDAHVAFLYSPDSRYAMQFMPPLKRPGSSSPDPLSYERIFNTFYRAFFDARAQAAIIDPRQDLAGFPVVVVPGLFISDDGLLAKLVRYADNGGHLVLSFRSGCADEYARMRWDAAPAGGLRKALGAGYDLHSNLDQPLPVRGDGGLLLPDDARALGWADELEFDDSGTATATPLAWYQHHHFGSYPAAVSNRAGHGRITYIGTLPDPVFGRSLAEWICGVSNVGVSGVELPEPVRTSTARTRSGEKLSIVINWSADQQAFRWPVSGLEILSGRSVTASEELTLPPWDVLVIKDAADASAASST